MPFFDKRKVFKVLSLILSATSILLASQPSEVESLKLFAIRGGTLLVKDMKDFSNQGLFDGEEKTLVISYFLIRHPKGDLIWDTGLPQTMKDEPQGGQSGNYRYTLKTKLTEQLASLDLQVADIELVTFSHLHPDHIGNANLFAQSTWIVQSDEYHTMFSEEMKANSEMFGLYDQLEYAEKRQFQRDYDVFGDGRVIIKHMPGHTGGHCVLLLRLEKAGNILLSGDLYTHREARKQKAVPIFNNDPKETFTSMTRFEALAKKENARIIIQHDMADFDTLPRFPSYLD